MWYLPLSITLEMKKTKTGWQVTHRVHFIHQEREGGRKLILLLQEQYMISIVFLRVVPSLPANFRPTIWPASTQFDCQTDHARIGVHSRPVAGPL